MGNYPDSAQPDSDPKTGSPFPSPALPKHETHTSGEAKVPTISLPKGGGAIRNIGEKFAINPATGTGSITIPLPVSAGRSGFGPQLNLSYNSGSGNGPFGFGWSLDLPSITRKTDKGLPRYLDGDESDVFVISGAEDLVPILDNAGQRISLPRSLHTIPYMVHLYRPRIEGLFARIERWTRLDNGVSYWRSISRDNTTTLYGLDENSRITDPRDPRRIFSYLICFSFDDRGNAIHYEYTAEDSRGVDRTAAHEANRTDLGRQTQRYLKTIRYGNVQPYFPDWSSNGAETPLPVDWHFCIILDYGDNRSAEPTPDQAWPVRPDPFSTYRPGFEVRSYRRCQRVLFFHDFPTEAAVGADCLVRSLDFQYSDQAIPADPRNPIYTFLESVTRTGYRRAAAGYDQHSDPPLEFFYSQPVIHPEILTLNDPDSRENFPEGLDGRRFHWVDLDGEGLPGILTEQAGGWGYKRNLGPSNQVTLPDGSQAARARFAPQERLPRLPVPAELSTQQLLDLSGGGRLDLATFAGANPGFFKHTPGSGWEPFRPFPSIPAINWSEPNLKFVDLTGDGRADVLITEADVYTFYPSLGEAGFGTAERMNVPWDEEHGPHVVFSDGTQTIALADMSGDGLSDIVRVRNGEISYWPNLGYGRFGAKVTMDNAPRFTDEERFDPQRMRWADVDGSGTSDLVYIGQTGVQVCFNRSGNAWAAPYQLAIFPDADPVSSVQVNDLLGNGTACLVWSSPLPGESYLPLRYIDLMGSLKPHLLVRVRNNLGAETRLAYAASTRFYLEDKQAGQPWITRLPFPVQVVERVESYDWIGRNRFVNRYTYHHGYFDQAEREFRGFGRVDQWDTGVYRGDTLFPEVEINNEDAASFVPPVLTRTWFHTGAFIEAGAVSQQYQSEYWVEPALRADSPANIAARAAMLLPDSLLEAGIGMVEIQEAYRALKGSSLRTEVYSEDGSTQAGNPYTITEQNFTVRLLQGRGPNQHAVFLTHPHESLIYHYERQPDDPRITHTLTLEVDEYANVLRSSSVGYPRRAGYSEPEPGLSATFRGMLAHDQTRLHISGTQQIFTDPLNHLTDAAIFDSYRVPLPAETITAELSGIFPAAARFGFDELDGQWAPLWSGTHDLPFEEVASADLEGLGASLPFGRRIVERTRTLYRRNDLTDLLPLKTLESQALPGESYRLALTPAMLTRIFGTRVTPVILAEGGYVQLPAQADWWIPSGRSFFSPGDADTPAQELVEARSHFYQVRRAIDPLGAMNRVSYDSYNLLPHTTTDAVGNLTSADNDYRLLQPFRVTDPNGNFNEAVFDCLGLLVGTAEHGQAGEGDSLAGFEADLTDVTIQSIHTDPLNAPAAILGNATTRIVYDRLAYFRTRDLPAPDPAWTYTLSRETHVSELGNGQTTCFRHVFAYSDGLGRQSQHKVQAEPGPVDGVGLNVAPRWVGSGWSIFNNKGKPVRKYEPFFSVTHQFEFARQTGVSAVLFYDPVERVVATLRPDNTWEKTVFDPWQQKTWDANDTTLISNPRTDPQAGDFFERLLGNAPDAFVSWHDRRIGGTWGATLQERSANQDAAQKAAAHAATPSLTDFDSLGRSCLSVADNGLEGGIPQLFATRTALDTENKPLTIFDASGRRAVEYCLREPQAGGGIRYVAGYDIAGNALYHNSMDGGERRALNNVRNKQIRIWDARGSIFRMLYDPLQRLTHRFIQPSGCAETLVERLVYGEKHPDAALNLKGKLFRHYDNSGLAAYNRYDFKGNLLESCRQFTQDYRASPDWSVITTVNDQPVLDLAALDAAARPFLNTADAFIASARFDALDRPVQMISPHRLDAPSNRPSVTQPTYNEANLLETVDVWVRQVSAPAMLLDPLTADIHAVSDIDYDAHGRRVRIAMGNAAVTTYTYDPETFRLIGLATSRPNPDPNALNIQALTYAYDPVGNVTRLRDDADIHNVVYFRNRRVEPSADYTYDPIYRLKIATGREHLGQTGNVLNAPQQITGDDSFRTGLLAPGDGNAMGLYTEQYGYDPAGNLLTLLHQVSSGSWTRHYSYKQPSQIDPTETCNRLSATSLPGDPPAGPYSALYGYDEHGNMTQMPHLPVISWNESDHIQTTAQQAVVAGLPELTYYLYDSDGQRQRKVTDRQAAAGQTPRRKSERLYLGAFEIYREYGPDGVAVTKERETFHIMDDKQPVALVETRTVGNDPGPTELIRYQFGNHLGSAVLELDDQADIISYEEYFPYGSSSYQAMRSQAETPKRYRYTAKERDEETDLYYYGARYYAPWLGRWTAADPIGIADGLNVYAYVRNNPILLMDPKGTNGNTTTVQVTDPSGRTTTTTSPTTVTVEPEQPEPAPPPATPDPFKPPSFLSTSFGSPWQATPEGFTLFEFTASGIGGVGVTRGPLLSGSGGLNGWLGTFRQGYSWGDIGPLAAISAMRGPGGGSAGGLIGGNLHLQFPLPRLGEDMGLGVYLSPQVSFGGSGTAAGGSAMLALGREPDTGRAWDVNLSGSIMSSGGFLYPLAPTMSNLWTIGLLGSLGSTQRETGASSSVSSAHEVYVNALGGSATPQSDSSTPASGNAVQLGYGYNRQWNWSQGVNQTNGLGIYIGVTAEYARLQPAPLMTPPTPLEPINAFTGMLRFNITLGANRTRTPRPEN